MSAGLGYAHQTGRAVALDVMSKDRPAIRLHERLGAHRIGEIVHHHSDGLTEPAIVFTFPRSGTA